MPAPSKLPFRQVHLDFHTSGLIEDIGRDFDPARFADTLVEAGVESITCFARCHHGFLYYPSTVNPERIHPHLARPELLNEQIAACHERGIRVPVYTTVQWDAFTTAEHRDWLCVDEDGLPFRGRPLEPGFYEFLDVCHPGYRQFLFDHVRELLASMPIDGLFFDIVQPRYSLAAHWLEAMEAAGVEPEDAGARDEFADHMVADWQLAMTEFIRSLADEYPDAADCTVFYNASHVGPRYRKMIAAYSHLELESLPSGSWGYLHFPMTQRYARHLAGGRPTLGMTGKFHTSWGDFHSYKNQAALDFECFHMLALGAGCSVGDQLHPLGELDGPTYDLIGRTFRSVRDKEPWCRDVQPVADAAVLTPEEFFGQPGGIMPADARKNESSRGATRLLQELKLQFDWISTERDFSAYRLLIVPEAIPADADLAAKLRAYLAGGGKLLVTGETLLDDSLAAFALDELGVSRVGPSDYENDFLVPRSELDVDRPAAPHVMYCRATQVSPADGATVLADVQPMYFNRTWRRFCSHRHAPSTFETAYPGIVESPDGSVIYFAHPVFSQYEANAPRWHKQLIDAAIRRLLPNRLVETDGPSGLIATLNEQPEPNRYVLHLLFYIPERRGQAFDTIEEVIPLHDVTVTLNLPGSVNAARCVPEETPIPMERDGDRVRFTVPRLDGHQMIELTA